MFDLLFSLITVFLFIPFLLLIIATIWVYNDGKKRNMNVYAWILIVWLFPLFIGLIIYILIREKHSTDRN